MGRPYRVFLSHSSRDGAWVELIREHTHGADVDVYLHEYDLQPGRLVAEKLQDAILDCDALIVLLTRKSAKSPYVHQEVGYALAAGKRVVPLVEKGVPKNTLAMLDGREYLEFDPSEPLAAIQQLSVILRKHRPPIHPAPPSTPGRVTPETAKVVGSATPAEDLALLIVCGALLYLVVTAK